MLYVVAPRRLRKDENQNSAMRLRPAEMLGVAVQVPNSKFQVVLVPRISFLGPIKPGFCQAPENSRFQSAPHMPHPDQNLRGTPERRLQFMTIVVAKHSVNPLPLPLAGFSKPIPKPHNSFPPPSLIHPHNNWGRNEPNRYEPPFGAQPVGNFHSPARRYRSPCAPTDSTLCG